MNQERPEVRMPGVSVPGGLETADENRRLTIEDVRLKMFGRQ